MVVGWKFACYLAKLLIFDEIQNVPDWDRFIWTIYECDGADIEIILTGSNSELLDTLTADDERRELGTFSMADPYFKSGDNIFLSLDEGNEGLRWQDVKITSNNLIVR